MTLSLYRINLLSLNLSELELYRRKKVDVKANSGSSVSFMIIPRELGYITIKVTANSVLAGDSVEHKLLVNVMIFISTFCSRDCLTININLILL